MGLRNGLFDGFLHPYKSNDELIYDNLLVNGTIYEININLREWMSQNRVIWWFLSIKLVDDFKIKLRIRDVCQLDVVGTQFELLWQSIRKSIRSTWHLIWTAKEEEVEEARAVKSIVEFPHVPLFKQP